MPSRGIIFVLKRDGTNNFKNSITFLFLTGQDCSKIKNKNKVSWSARAMSLVNTGA